MRVSELSEMLGCEILTMPNPDSVVSGGYCGDLLSWVMGRAEAGDAWITIMTNINIVAVALLTGVGVIIIADNSPVADDVIKKAAEEGVNILRNRSGAFDTAAAVARALDK